jgi:acyl-CoA synthetase (AMP-forming)/AMP-acid ligase II
MTEPAPGTLDFSVRHNPQGEALVDGAIRRTYDEWDERACRLASFLRDRWGIGRGDRVAWMMHNRAEHYDLSFALQKLGALPVAIGFRLTGSEAAYIVDDSDAKAVVCEPAFAPRLEAALAAMPKVPEDRFLVVGSERERGGVLPKATLFDEAIAAGSPERFRTAGGGLGGSIIYTSGTTGRPKGAFRDSGQAPLREGMREFTLGVIQGFGYAPPDRHLLCCPLYHSAPPALAGITHLLAGPVVIMRRFDAEEMLRLIQDEGITSAFLVPTMLNRLTSLPEEILARYDLSSMKRLVVGAAPFPTELKRRVIDLFPNPCLYEFYGATETAINTIIGPEDHLRKPGWCGRVCPGNEIKLLDEEGREVPAGEPGMLYVRNPFLITGYYKKRAATEECLDAGFFTVGDVARVDEEGFYYIVDRKKDMIISGGVNIYPAEIESELRQHPAVYDCAVIGVPNEDWGEEVKAVVQLREGASADEEGIRAFLSERLADYKQPRSVDFVDELPYNPSGKLLKRELRKRYWEAAGRTI